MSKLARLVDTGLRIVPPPHGTRHQFCLPLPPQPLCPFFEATLSAQKLTKNHLHRKLTPLEISFIPPTEQPEVILRRLCIMLALKEAYIKAIGQPIGFDYSRLEFNLPGESARGDGYPLTGWEFRLWQSQIAVMRDDGEVETQSYQCASAFFRGTPESVFIWQKDRKELESWVQFLNIDQLITVLPKLTD